MAVPLSFLAGLLVLVLHEALEWTLPGAGSPALLCALAPLWLLPAIVSARLHRQLASTLMLGRPVRPGLLLALRLVPLLVAIPYGLLVFVAHYADLAARIAHGSHLIEWVGLAAPLLLLEATLRHVRSRHLRWLEAVGLSRGSPLDPDRRWSGWFLFVPLAAAAALLDLVTANRDLEVFFVATSFGRLLGLLLLLLAMLVLLPLAVRWLLPLTPELPARHEAGIRAALDKLGFPRRNVLALDTGHRFPNAALVGPLRWPRYLLLTDALLALLEPFALRGVVAHEVGHARAGHPAWLLIVLAGIPLLLLQPALAFAPEPGAWLPLGAGLLLAAPLLLWSLRRLMHRFEHEADLLAARALGGAAPCIEALRRVAELYPAAIHEPSLRHPSEWRRIELMQRAESEPGFHGRFARRGRILRAGLLAAVALAAFVTLRHELASWPLDRVEWSIQTGRFAAAQERLAALPSPASEAERERRQRLAQQAELGRRLAPLPLPWHELAPRLGAIGLERGVERLRAFDAAGASAWLTLAAGDPDAGPVLQSLRLFALALERADRRRAEQLHAHLASLAPPAEIAAAAAAALGALAR